MNQEVIKIIKDIEKNNKVDYNNIFLNRKLEDLDIIAIITYCLKNKIDETCESFDVDYNDFPNFFYSDFDIIEELENFADFEQDYDDKTLNEYSKIALSQAIKNTRINFSINDIRQEALISMLKFKNNFYEKLKIKYNEDEMKYIFKNFIKREILLFQKKEIDDIKEQEYLHLLYIKIKSELNDGLKLDDILKRIGISVDFYEKLKNMFLENDYNLTYEEILEHMDKINKKYELALNTNKLSYIEELILNEYLGLEDEKLSLEQISEDKKIKKELLQEYIKNSIYKVSLVYNKEILEKLTDLIEDK